MQNLTRRGCLLQMRVWLKEFWHASARGRQSLSEGMTHKGVESLCEFWTGEAALCIQNGGGDRRRKGGFRSPPSLRGRGGHSVFKKSALPSGRCGWGRGRSKGRGLQDPSFPSGPWGVSARGRGRSQGRGVSAPLPPLQGKSGSMKGPAQGSLAP